MYKSLGLKRILNIDFLSHLGKCVHEIIIEVEEALSGSKSNTTSVVLSQFVAEDCISINAIKKSKMVRALLKSINPKIHSSATTIWKIIYDSYDGKKKESFVFKLLKLSSLLEIVF